jgi:class 3 adenylate cyclase
MAEVNCTKCGEANAPTQRFCGGCGAPLSAACPSCGAENPPGFRFCGTCGSALGARSAPEVATGTEERRWTTVLFGDLSGFTKLSERMDPEDVRALVDRSISKLGEIVERYEGRVERVTGDEIMVVFGAPVAHEDDPERAVRTALEMQRFATDNATAFGDLPLRVGVNTGEVMFAPVGPEGARQLTVMGDIVNTASRLQTAAPLGGVLVGQATYDATKHSIRYEPVEPIRAKGKEAPVAAWVAVEATSEPAVRPLSEVPLVGRQPELDLLRRTWERVVADRRAQLVTVIGPPGIGKSKLAREFVASLQGTPSYWGRSLPYGERAGGAFGQIIRVVAEVYVTDDLKSARTKLSQAVHRIVGAPDEELAGHLATIVGQGADVDRMKLVAAARRFVEALVGDQPAVVVFEDLQWGDESLLELIPWLVSRLGHAPILFLTLTRPELFDTHAGWGGGLTAYTTLPLAPLPEDHVRELAHLLRSDLDDKSIDRIEQSSGGNPLFIEELTAWLSEERPDAKHPLPTTVTSIVAARLDALPTVLRQILLDASVASIGMTFWRGSIEALNQGDVADALDELVTRDLINRRQVSRMPDDEEYVFRHQVIHDVAYDILPKVLRRERHETIARYIEGRVANVEVVAGILANHWQQAGDNDRAIDYLIQAAEVAGRGWEQIEAFELLKQALQLVPQGDKARKRSITLKLAVARQIWAHAILDAETIRLHAEGSAEPHEH